MGGHWTTVYQGITWYQYRGGTLDHLTFYLCWQSGLDVDQMRSQEYAFTSSREELIGKSYRPILKLITPDDYLLFRAARNQMDSIDSWIKDTSLIFKPCHRMGDVCQHNTHNITISHVTNIPSWSWTFAQAWCQCLNCWRGWDWKHWKAPPLLLIQQQEQSSRFNTDNSKIWNMESYPRSLSL